MSPLSLYLLKAFLLSSLFLNNYHAVELKSNSNIRIFHPSFPLKLKDPITAEEFNKLNSIREKLQFSPMPNQSIELPSADILKRLPVSCNNISIFFFHQPYIKQHIQSD